MSLPNAEQQTPACGACGADTDWDGDDWACYDCLIYFNPDTLEASFLDPDGAARACGHPCDNTWHGDHKIKPGHGFECGTCELPAGHTSPHWFGCQPVRITEAANA